MQQLVFVTAFALWLLTGQPVIMIGLAFAKHTPNHCCMCGTCNTWCYCSGQANCRCVTNDGKGIPPASSTFKVMFDIRDTYGLHLHTDALTTESMLSLVRASRLRETSVMTLTDHLADHMRFKCMHSEL
jgi:hypothetical protein